MKLLLLRAAVLLLLAIPASAQKASFWKHLQRPDAGGSLRFMTIAGTDSTEAIDLVGFGGMGGFSLPFLEVAEDMSLGFSPNAYSGVYFSRELLAMSIELPAYLTFKWGTDATWGGSKSWFGTTAGLGYQYNIMFTEGEVFTYGIPSLMAEINFGKRRGGVGLIKLRYTMGIGDHTEELSRNGEIYAMTMSQHSFDLLITSGY